MERNVDRIVWVCLMLLGYHFFFFFKKGFACLFLLHVAYKYRQVTFRETLLCTRGARGRAIRLIANVVQLLTPSKSSLLFFLTVILIPNFILKCIDSNNAKLIFKQVSKPFSL